MTKTSSNRLNSSSKRALQVIIPLGLALGLFWYLYKDLSLDQLTEALGETSFFWVFLSVVISLLGYYIRAWRWQVLINAGRKNKVNLSPVFWSLMVGYLVNLILPRAGELARCAALNRVKPISMGNLLGTVVLERTVDMLFMLLTVFLALLVENHIFVTLLNELGILGGIWNLVDKFWPFILIGIALLFIIGYLVFKGLGRSQFVQKARHFVMQFMTGFKSLAVIEKVWGFWLASVSIWIIYYLMMYWLALAMPVTQSLSPSAVLMVMVMGSIGMVVPVQGGIGTFHALVAFILLYYGVAEAQGKIFAIVVHGSQVLTIILVGLLSVWAIWYLVKKLKPEPK